MTTLQSPIKIFAISVPDGLSEALSRARLKYSSAEAIFYVVSVVSVVSDYVGVFGDPDNGSYEWFAWSKGALRHSDCGYGECSVALRDVIAKEMADY